MTYHLRRQIYVTFQKEGMHCYPAALTDPALKDVSFLGHPHRHVFHFKVTVDVRHDDREIEFILLKRELEGLFEDKVLDIDYKSCEMLAEDIGKYVLDKYGSRRQVIVEVSEDGENGAVITFNT